MIIVPVTTKAHKQQTAIFITQVPQYSQIYSQYSLKQYSLIYNKSSQAPENADQHVCG